MTDNPASESFNYRKLAVLIVDDEPQAVKYFQMSFGTEFDVRTATSVDQAVPLLEAEPQAFGVVITDQRMPGKTGVDLLTRVRRINPRIVRILTTAYSDLDSAIEAVNSGAIYKYIVKPWNLRDLRGTLMRALEFALVQRERDLLLREKLSVLQRVMMADRVRAFAFLAAGISNQIRNSMSALKEFVDQAPAVVEMADPSVLTHNPEFWSDIWSLARQETEMILTTVNRVSSAVTEPSYAFKDCDDFLSLLRSVATSQGATFAPAARLTVPSLRIDDQLIVRLFTSLLSKAQSLSQSTEPVRLVVEQDAADSLRILIQSQGAAWSEQQVGELFNPFPKGPQPLDQQLDLLAAFFIAHHHGGEITVHPAPPAGPCFQVTLPLTTAAKKDNESYRGMLEHLYLRLQNDHAAAM
jgi:two-component system, probable response regulator PhcQ